MNDELDYIDLMILNEASHSADVRDGIISTKLSVSRSVVMERLRSLLQNGYIFEDNGQIGLTQCGKDVVEYLELDNLNSNTTLKKDTYNWDFLYIPPKGWNLE